MSKGCLVVILVLSAFWSETILAQPSVSVEPSIEAPLKIGDRIPDFHFREVLNYATPTARLSAFRGRLTILDFWASPCTGCVGLFPHLQKLQDHFGGAVKIVLVDAQATIWHDDAAKVARALSIEGAAIGERISMPVVLNSPELFAAFPYLRVPHEVWIDSAGTILAVTDAYAVTSSNIQKVLSGQHVAFPTKVDIDGNLERKSLAEVLSQTPVSIASPLHSSLVYRGNLFGLSGSGVRRDDEGRLIGLYRINEQLIDLYGSIFTDKMTGLMANRLVVEASNSERFLRFNGFDSLGNATRYSYDINGAPTTMDSMLAFSQVELNNVFHTKVFIAKRRVRCVVLGLGPSADTGRVAMGTSSWTTDLKDSIYHLSNVTVTDLVSSLNGGGLNMPFVWESSYIGTLNGYLPLALYDKAALEDWLRKDGISVRMEDRDLDVVVIGDQ